jgi:hypothetical protein
MSSYSPDVRQFHKAKQAEAVRNAKHAQQQRQQGRKPAGGFGFDRTRLPAPAAYYESQGLALKGRGAWLDAVCPFHADSKPSLRVKIETGAFSCMACGAHGGDVLAYHMQLHNMDFKAAAVSLGAWIGGTR